MTRDVILAAGVRTPFGDFGGLQSDLGYSHRVSLRYTLQRERYVREPTPAPMEADAPQ